MIQMNFSHNDSGVWVIYMMKCSDSYDFKFHVYNIMTSGMISLMIHADITYMDHTHSGVIRSDSQALICSDLTQI